MSFYIYRRASSDSARALTNALSGVRCVGELGAPRKLSRIQNEDAVIFWGDYLRLHPQWAGKTLNYAPVGSKITDALKLKEKGVATIEISTSRPVVGPPADDGFDRLAAELQEAAFDFAETTPDRRSDPYKAGVNQLHQTLSQFRELLNGPLPQPLNVEWLPRKKNHVGGNDLLTPTTDPDYWVKKETIAKEFRVHSFKGKSIRAGQKIPREDFSVNGELGNGTLHSWVRSWDGGWRISYDGDSVRQKHRDIAHAAITALGLDFGAVDVAERPDGSVFVLEVNRAPGIEAGTIDAYASAIRRWAEGTF